jgi:hypothetical protein
MTDIVQYKLNSLISDLTTKTLSTKEHEIICIQINLLDSLITEYKEATYYSFQDASDHGFDEYYGYEEAEFEERNPYYYFSDIDRYMLERRDLIEEQIDIAHENLYFTRGMGKSIIASDSYWFTSDEIEAFRVIWQRRISAM